MDKLGEAAAEALRNTVEGLGKIAAGIGVQAERLWPEIIKAYWAQNVGKLALMIVLGVAVYVVGTKVLRYLWAWDVMNQNDGRDMVKVIGLFLVGAVMSIYTLSILEILPRVFASVVSPEGQFVLELIQRAMSAR